MTGGTGVPAAGASEARAQAECGWGLAYAQGLLADLGVGWPTSAALPINHIHPARRWSESGLMALTGEALGPPQMCPIPLAAYADGILAALRALSPTAELAVVDGAALLTARAELGGFTRRGAISPGGACRLLVAADGWLAVNLPRPEDWELLPAWLQCGCLSSWQEVAGALASLPLEACLERGRLLGLAVAPLVTAGREPAGNDAAAGARWLETWYPAGFSRRAVEIRHGRAPRVVDLSSLWAGPLCSHLLQLMGAQVIKVESGSRPDGTRQGMPRFYELLNAGKSGVTADFGSVPGRARLRELLLQADIVIEGSRPRALRQLGIVAEEILAVRPQLTWVSISGHGRGEPQENWIAYGDDAAVAGGLSAVMLECAGAAMFCGDAIADPLTGLHAALAAWCGFLGGGGGLRSLGLRGVVAHAVRWAAAPPGESLAQRARRWRGYP
ncbi:MAG: CoA transferase [Proteobacteria bacterium]|nr:CoA transferase [Pseudomonadota bacterium]